MNSRRLNPSEENVEQETVRDKVKVGTRVAWVIMVACAPVAIVCVAFPMYVIRPSRPQGVRELALALAVRNAGPWVSILCALVTVIAFIWLWRRMTDLFMRLALVAIPVIALACVWLSHLDMDEMEFHPYDSPAFTDANAANVVDDKVLAVKVDNEAHAYPLRALAYHHVVNDTLGGVPIAATYCSLCHTGLVWKRVVDGVTLHFKLAGINNGNALMQDQETGTIWQQSTGEAIFGAMKGRQLELVHSDELSFPLWSKEEPKGQVLKPDAPYAPAYKPKDWEERVGRMHAVIDTSQSGIPPHELMLGITRSGQSKAYPIRSILGEKLIQDRIAGEPILLMVGPDQVSVRVFRGQLDDRSTALTFFRKEDAVHPANEQVVVDEETSSAWNFQGCAIDGKLAGHCLKPLDANKDYWFDWLNHHPGTIVFRN
jgi:Protein of unknown function (DUF3179)